MFVGLWEVEVVVVDTSETAAFFDMRYPFSEASLAPHTILTRKNPKESWIEVWEALEVCNGMWEGPCEIEWRE